MRVLNFLFLSSLLHNPMYAMSDADLRSMHKDFSFDWIMRLHDHPDEVTLASLDALYNLEKNELTEPNILQITHIASFDWNVGGIPPSPPQVMQVASTTAYALSHTIIGHLIQITDKKENPEPILDKIVALCTCRYFGMLDEGMWLYTAEAIAESIHEQPAIAQLITQRTTLHNIIQDYYIYRRNEITHSVREAFERQGKNDPELAQKFINKELEELGIPTQ